MARMILAGCLWHAMCLMLALADSQCVDGQDSHCVGGQEAGLKSQSLVQLNTGRQTTLALDTSSDSLMGFSQMVQDLAEKVAGHNYTLSKAESDAIELIRKWIENMNKTLNVQHKEDQAEVDRVRDLIQGCTSSTNKLLTMNVSAYNKTTNTDRKAHKQCREKQKTGGDLQNAACDDYDRYRKGLTPYLNGDEVPPSCLASLTKDKIATSVAATQDSMETCLVGTHAWLLPLYARYKLCDRRKDNHTNITKRCDKLQETFESSFCSYELKLSDTCDYHSTCRKRELEDRSKTHQEVKISEQARKADYVTGRKVSCLFDVFLADNPNKTDTLNRCRALQVSTSPFDIIYHPAPPGQPCFKEPSKPCDVAWTNKEYGSLSASAKTCTPCPLPTLPGNVAAVSTAFNNAASGVFNGETIRISSGYVETKRTYQRPVDMSVMMRQVDTSSDECGVVALFPPGAGRHSGYNAGVGWWGQYFGTGAPGASTSGKMPSTTKEWHTVRINAAADGKVYFYVDGELRRQVNHDGYQSGVIRLGNNCRNYEYKNLVATEATTVPAPAPANPYTEYIGGCCSGKNELGTPLSNPTLDDCKKWCSSESSCVSFEVYPQSHTTTNFNCWFSRTCTANEKPALNCGHDLYIKQ